MDKQYGLIDLFNNYFEIIFADTPETLRECYRLRYEVYYEEGLFPGMNSNDCPDGLEHDEYDARAMQCLLLHKRRGTIAGTVRIIPTAPDNPDAKLPLEEIAGHLFYPDVVRFNEIPRAQLGEISRLILTLGFRARKGENQHTYGGPETGGASIPDNANQTKPPPLDDKQPTPQQLRAFPHAILGLFVAIVKMSAKLNLVCWYCNMEPACARFLRSFGVTFKPIAPVIDYHGPRQGYFAYIADIMENLYQTNRPLWALVTENGVLFPRNHSVSH